jgi:hypothetical protein
MPVTEAPSGRTATATSLPDGLGTGSSDAGRLRAYPRSLLSAAAVASSTGGRPTSRSTIWASAPPWIEADGAAGAATDTKAPGACGSPATWSPAPSETARPVASGTTEMGLLDDCDWAPKSCSITRARS